MLTHHSNAFKKQQNTTKRPSFGHSNQNNVASSSYLKIYLICALRLCVIGNGSAHGVVAKCLGRSSNKRYASRELFDN